MAENSFEQDSHPVHLTPEEELIVKEAIVRHQKVLNVDPANELALFKQRLAWKQKQRRMIWSAVASFLIVLGVGTGLILYYGNTKVQEQIVVYEATDSVGGSLLYMDGKPISLNSEAALLALQKLGAEVTEDGIKYSSEGESMMNTITTSYGQTFTISLSDGSVVQLNSNSKFTYPTIFTEAEREVELKGEAYFTVTKDSKHPFIVHTEDVDTKVLGTEFNVRNYGGEPSTITLVKGSIEVITPTRLPMVLKPGQTLIYSNPETNELEVTNDDIREYIEWKSGYFYFNDKPLHNVFRIIGRYYNITVVCDDWDLMKTHFNLWVDMSLPLDENLKIINEVSGLHIGMKNNKVTIKK